MSHYTNHSIVVQDDADASATVIGSLTSVSAPIDQEVLKEETAGQVYPEQISVVSQKPRATFNSFDLPKVIDAFGLLGRKVVEGTGKPGFAITQAKYDNGALVSGSNHRRLKFPLSHSRINRLSVSHRQDAQVECETVAIYDGSNDPVVIEGSQALPSLPSSPGRWTIGAVQVGGQAITCKIQLDIDFGFSVDAFGCDDEHWDSHFHVNQAAPQISITSLDPENFSDSKVILEGLVGTHANTKIVLKKRTASQASYVADATAEHIEITLAGVILVTDAHNASGNQKAQSTYQVEAAWDGSNAPLLFDTAYAIA